MKKLPDFKIDLESTDKVSPLYQHFWSEISWQWNSSPLNFFLNLHGRAFCFLNFVILVLLIFLKCIVVGYSNRNQSFTCRLFSNYGPWNMLFHIFRYLIYSVFHEDFVKSFMKKLPFFNSNFKNPFQNAVYYRKLECLTLWYWNGGPLNIR